MLPFPIKLPKKPERAQASFIINMTVMVITLHLLVYSNAIHKISPFSLNLAFSETTGDDNWSVQIDNIDINSNLPTSSTEKKELPTPRPSETPPKIKTEEKTNLSFTVSNSIIDYGILSATNPIYRTTNISVAGNAKSPLVLEYEDRPLNSPSGNIIPDTTCDNGSCSQFTTALWENTLTYGFGYRCENVSGSNCPLEFAIKNYYKQFSDISRSEEPQIIMFPNNPQVAESQIIYKVNISKSQPEGSYKNTIDYIAVPGY